MKQLSLILIAFVVLATACGSEKKTSEEQKVKIETVYGDMVVKLYNETPLHRDNFIKLSQEQFFDSLLFHRVIKNFMIQGGDPDSKNAPEGKQLGEGGPGYQIDAEFVEGIFHKKGVIAAAREGDKVNPEKKSAGSQFYIVQGKTFTLEQLNKFEDKINFRKSQDRVYSYVKDPENIEIRKRVDSLTKAKDYAKVNMIYSQIAADLKKDTANINLFKFSDEQIEIYTTVGGTPHLDNNYTVFGEVVEGLHVVDSIAGVSTDSNDRPLEDLIMKISVVK